MKVMPLISAPPLYFVPVQDLSKPIELQLKIRSDGSLGEIDIIASTHYYDLIGNIRNGVLKSQPLPPPPVQMRNGETYKITLTYTLAHDSKSNSARFSFEPSDFINDELATDYMIINPSTGGITGWERFVPVGQSIRTKDEAITFYTPATNPADQKGNVAILLRRGDEFTFLPFNYHEDAPDQLNYTQNVKYLISKYDPASKRYLIFRNDLLFNTPSWDKNIPSWEHFDAWWLDTSQATVEHIILPPGPWVTDAKLDGVFLRGFRNFSCGVDCYRGYEIRVENGNIIASISGRTSAISKSATGTYRLNKNGTDWEKIKN